MKMSYHLNENVVSFIVIAIVVVINNIPSGAFIALGGVTFNLGLLFLMS